MAKAAAAVANSSSSPVKELRDLSAMDAFRSRSISVSEHAVRRLEKSLLGNQQKKQQQQPKHLFVFFYHYFSSMGWLMGCQIIVMRDRWEGVGWFCSRENLERVLHARWKVCVFWAAIIHVLSYILFCHDLLLHVVFRRRHWKTFDVFFSVWFLL